MVKTILIIAVLALAGLLLFAATRPDRFSLQRSIVIQALPDKLHALINDLHQSPGPCRATAPSSPS